MTINIPYSKVSMKWFKIENFLFSKKLVKDNKKRPLILHEKC
jgi:hypothetical protein